MARVRRKATAKTRLNFEIAGIAAIGLAVLLGIALLLPRGAGFAGAATAHGLSTLFGGAASLFPVLVALFGAIIFLEINVPRMIATLGCASAGYFLIIDAAFGRRGGVLGSALWYGLQALIGTIGARVALVLAALLLAVWITNVSVKKVIGWLIVTLSKLRVPKVQLALPQSHANLRQAFDLPASAANVPVEAFVPPAGSAIVVEDSAGGEDEEYDGDEDEEDEEDFVDDE